MTFKQKLTFGFISFLIPATVIAAAPGNVKGVQANLQGNKLTVIWSGVPEAAVYRVYYSHESILNNGGNYDDFVATSGPQTSYVFPGSPLQSPKLFIAVLAVDSAGVESEGFETEASIDVPTTSSSSASSEISSSESSSASSVAPLSSSASSSVEALPTSENPVEPMKVTSVEAVSETGVLVIFSKNVKSDAKIDTMSFLMTTASGTMLSILKTEVSGNEVLLTTSKQEAGKEYIFTLLAFVAAEDNTAAAPGGVPMKFGSFITESSSSSSSLASSMSSSSSYGRNPEIPSGEPQEQPTLPQDPGYLNLGATPRSDGNYNVLAEWGAAQGAESYSLYTSKKNATYIWSSMVGQDQTKVQFSRIPPGRFGVKVASKNAAGESTGIEKVIDLPASGAGFLGIAAAAGALAARRMKRRKSA
jgi:hypothetical protein